MKDILISSAIQISLVLILVLFFYFITCRKKNGFFNWIGLFLPKNKRWIISSIIVFIVSLVVMVGALILFQSLGYITSEIFYDKTISGQGLGISTVIIILVKAIVQTSMSEEILFRGLIGKRIANKFGYLAGNITQSILFCLPHGLPFVITRKEYILGITLIITTGIVGYLLFWLNEKKADGSLIPSILLHSIMNISSFMIKRIS